MCGSLFDFISHSKFCIYTTTKKRQPKNRELWLCKCPVDSEAMLYGYHQICFVYLFFLGLWFFFFHFSSFVASFSRFYLSSLPDCSSVSYSSNLLLFILPFSSFAQFFSFTTRMNRFSYILFFAYTLIRHHWSYRLYLDAILLVIASIVIYRCQFCSSQHILLLLCILCAARCVLWA